MHSIVLLVTFPTGCNKLTDQTLIYLRRIANVTLIDLRGCKQIDLSSRAPRTWTFRQIVTQCPLRAQALAPLGAEASGTLTGHPCWALFQEAGPGLHFVIHRAQNFIQMLPETNQSKYICIKSHIASYQREV